MKLLYNITELTMIAMFGVTIFMPSTLVFILAFVAFELNVLANYVYISKDIIRDDCLNKNFQRLTLFEFFLAIAGLVLLLLIPGTYIPSLFTLLTPAIGMSEMIKHSWLEPLREKPSLSVLLFMVAQAVIVSVPLVLCNIFLLGPTALGAGAAFLMPVAVSVFLLGLFISLPYRLGCCAPPLFQNYADEADENPTTDSPSSNEARCEQILKCCCSNQFMDPTPQAMQMRTQQENNEATRGTNRWCPSIFSSHEENSYVRVTQQNANQTMDDSPNTITL